MATSSKTKVKLWLSRGRGTFAPARFLAMTRQGFHGRFASRGLACPPIFGPLSVPIHRCAILLCDEAVKMRAVDSCVHRLCSCGSHRCLYDWPAPSASPCCQTRHRRPRSPGQRLQTTPSNRRWCGSRTGLFTCWATTHALAWTELRIVRRVLLFVLPKRCPTRSVPSKNARGPA